MTGPAGPTGRVVSVVVPHYDDRRLPACLDALRALESPPGWRVEIIVVDNGSDVPPRELVESLGNATFLIELRRGSYAARNTAIAVSTGEIIAFTDSDCRPAPDWLTVAVGRLEREPALAAVAGRVETVFDTQRPESAVGWWDAVEAFPQHTYVREGYGVTANLVVRREAGESVGWFDAASQSGGDSDFGRRLTRSGLVLAYEADAVVSHPARTSWRELSTKGRRTAKGTARMEAIQGAGARELAMSVFWLAVGIAKVVKRTFTHPRLPDASARLQYLAVGLVYRLFWFTTKYRWRLHYRGNPPVDAPGA